MRAEGTPDEGLKYDRQLLLLGPKRNALLDLSDVRRYGKDSYGDPDYVSIYGMRPAQWYGRGIRLLGRTAVECTRDDLADSIARDIAALAVAAAPGTPVVAIDPFAGSGNTLYWMLRNLPGARGVGFELDDAVFRLTVRNFSALGLPVDIRHTDYETGLRDVAVGDDDTIVAFIAPPWGSALDPSSGLDLRRTTPPIAEVVEHFFATFRNHVVLCAVQIYERVEPSSMADLQARFDRASVRSYTLNAPGANHGIVLGERRPAARVAS
ncbi:MAG TPA: hypothetical protein VNT02_13745, partial [Burkholderiales bacterium]|nr:hypothetical protein [Burkholderiales bacterium]